MGIRNAILLLKQDSISLKGIFLYFLTNTYTTYSILNTDN